MTYEDRMKVEDFKPASDTERKKQIVRPYDEVPMTTLVPGSESHLVFGQNATISFITMQAGAVFELHSHPEEQIMYVLEGYCDEIVAGKIYRLEKGDAIYLPSNIVHGAFIYEVDCKAIDFFAPARSDYAQKFREQNPGVNIRFID
jgi:quercetin dioxygenase-like cupin family protein